LTPEPNRSPEVSRWASTGLEVEAMIEELNEKKVEAKIERKKELAYRHIAT